MTYLVSGAVEAIRRAGRKEIKVASIDGDRVGFQMLLEEDSPFVATVVQDVPRIGELAAQTVLAALKGEKNFPSTIFTNAWVTTHANVVASAEKRWGPKVRDSSKFRAPTSRSDFHRRNRCLSCARRCPSHRQPSTTPWGRPPPARKRGSRPFRQRHQAKSSSHVRRPWSPLYHHPWCRASSPRFVGARCRGISRAFPGVVALDHVDLAIRRGEIHGLVGQNGAGKSTLVKILTGVYAADKGEILLDGALERIANPNDADARHRHRPPGPAARAAVRRYPQHLSRLREG